MGSLSSDERLRALWDAIDRVDKPTHVMMLAGLIRQNLPWLAQQCEGVPDDQVVTIDIDAMERHRSPRAVTTNEIRGRSDRP